MSTSGEKGVTASDNSEDCDQTAKMRTLSTVLSVGAVAIYGYSKKHRPDKSVTISGISPFFCTCFKVPVHL